MDLNKMSLEDVCQKVAYDQDLKLEIAENMRQFGGSFVKALAECLIRADKDNLYTLCNAFTNYILDYRPERWAAKK